MIFSRTKVIICFLLSFILQPFVGALFGFDNFGPNILLCASTILLVLYRDSPLIWGCAIGFGILYDICFSSVIGFAASGILISMLGVLIVNYFFYLDNILLVPILAIIDTICFNLIGWFISSSQGSLYTFGYMAGNMALDLLCNIVTLFVFYLIVKKYLVRHKNDMRVK